MIIEISVFCIVSCEGMCDAWYMVCFMTHPEILLGVFYNFSLVVGIRKTVTSYFMTYYKILPIVVYNFSLVVGIRKTDTSYFMTWYKILPMVFYNFSLVIGIRKYHYLIL